METVAQTKPEGWRDAVHSEDNFNFLLDVTNFS